MNHRATPSAVYLEDYAPPPFLIPQIELDIDLVSEEDGRIRAALSFGRKSGRGHAGHDPAARPR